jgi:hypothetical protein
MDFSSTLSEKRLKNLGKILQAAAEHPFFHTKKKKNARQENGGKIDNFWTLCKNHKSSHFFWQSVLVICIENVKKSECDQWTNFL